MKIETFDRDDHQKLITAETDMETLEQFKHQAARKISAQAKISGFRPGKAPYEVVSRMYGEEAIKKEALALLIEYVYPQAIKDSGINPYGPGQLEDMPQGEPPKFSFIVPLVPEVSLGDYHSIRADYTPPVIGDEQVDDVIRRLQRSTAIATPVERPAAEGDRIDLKLAGSLKQADEGMDTQLIPETDRQMIAGDPRDFTDEIGNEWPFPGFSANLIGLSAGDERTLEYVFPDDGSSDDLVGKEGVFTLKVERVHQLETHPLDDEFAQSLGPYETYEKLRQGIQQDMQADRLTKYNNNFIDAIVDQMIAGATVKYPPVALEQEIELTLTRFEERLKRDQMDLDTYLKTRELTREQFIEQETKQVAEQSLKRNLVLEQFSVLEKIQISNEEAQMILNLTQTQALQDPRMKSLAKNGLTKKQVAENLARSTMNEIFSQRMMSRMRDIATGRTGLSAETSFIEPVGELLDETVSEGSPEAILDIPAEAASETVLDIPTEATAGTPAETQAAPDGAVEEDSPAATE